MREPPESRTLSDLDLEVTEEERLPSRRDDVEELTSDSVTSVFGSCARTGDWPVPDRLRAAAFFGDVKLDFREATLPLRGIVEVDATAIFGDLKLIVPAGTDVDMAGGHAVFGEFREASAWLRTRSFFRRWVMGIEPDTEEPEPEPEDEEPLLLRVRGFALFGSVLVSNR